MTTAAIREKLHEYIRVADDKKLKAIYTILESEIEDPYDHWNDPVFVEEMERRSKEMENDKVKTYSWNEVQKKAKQALQKARNKK